MAAPKPYKKKLVTKSERVKSIDMHPKEPLVICSLFNGKVDMWDYEQNVLLQSFDVAQNLPVRCVRFIVRQSWFICGSDDMQVRVYNFNTMEKVKTLEAHQDYLRALAVHDQLPYVLTSSDDMTVKMWDWSKDWKNVKTFDGHTHYVMAVTFNPKDPSTFATASLDRTVKVWNINSDMPNFTLEGHEAGVNCVEYFPGGDKPYIISGSDDRSVRIWDYQTKQCLQVLEGHTHNVVGVLFHPDVPLILSASEDETVKVWQLSTYRLETTIDLGLARCWTLAARAGQNKLAIGCDEGTVVVKMGKARFCYTMDGNGKIIVAHNNEIQQMNVRSAIQEEVVDGDKIPLQIRELGTQESPPKKIQHNCNGQFIVVLSESEYTINTALAWRSKTFGPCRAFVWGPESGTYAVLNDGEIKLFKNFKEKSSFSAPGSNVHTLFGGPLLGVVSEGTVMFYDWEVQSVGPVRKIAARPKNVYWNETAELCCLVSDGSFFLLKFNRDAVDAEIQRGVALPDEGVEDAFELMEEVEEKVRHGTWIGDCFVYTNRSNRLNYYIGNESYNLAVLERPFFLLGYVPKENRVFLIDTDRTIVSYRLPLAVIEFQTAIVRGDLEGAKETLLPKVPQESRTKIAQFLDAQGHKELAMEVTLDNEHKFELAVQLNELGIAQQIAAELQSKMKWKQLGDLALQNGNFTMAAEALRLGEDYNGLLLLHSSTSNSSGLKELAVLASGKDKHNVSMLAHYLSGDVSQCVDILIASERYPEAALFARSYCPASANAAVQQWKLHIGPNGPQPELLREEAKPDDAVAEFNAAVDEEEQEEEQPQPEPEAPPAAAPASPPAAPPAAPAAPAAAPVKPASPVEPASPPTPPAAPKPESPKEAPPAAAAPKPESPKPEVEPPKPEAESPKEPEVQEEAPAASPPAAAAAAAAPAANDDDFLDDDFLNDEAKDE